MGEISILQIILALIAILFLLNGFFKFIKRERSQTFFKLLLNSFIWGVILLFSTFPQSSRAITSKLGFGENLNTLIFIGFIIIFVIIFRLVSIIERAERNISELVRKEALRNIEK